jgi:hypothetical protein
LARLIGVESGLIILFDAGDEIANWIGGGRR